MSKIGKCILIVLGFLLALFLLWAFKDEARAMLLEPPEVCALCGRESREVPCLLDISTGEVGPLAGTTLPGKFQYIGLPGAWGGWDSDARTGQVTLPQEDPLLLVPLFCRSCRWAIMENPARLYYIADLSDPQDPQLYPIGEEPLTILGWTITPEDTTDGTTLTISPAP